MNRNLMRIMRKVGIVKKVPEIYTDRFVQLHGQNANDYIRFRLRNSAEGFMVSKWGTIELSAVCTLCMRELNIPQKDVFNGKVKFDEIGCIEALINNAGFFPKDIEKGKKFAKQILNDLREIDVLGSYLERERYVEEYTRKAVKVDLEGYYAPFLWEKPWTSELKGKKILVVHPFADSIREQYKRRELLFKNKDVLPEFERLVVIKAVQSAAGNWQNSGYADWFEALDYMKNEIDNADYDVALIGCGAYGMPLAAHVKRQGKVAIHLAGWTQMLFGIYGKRWVEDQPQYSKFINQYWVRPGENERPLNAETVEGGCYW